MLSPELRQFLRTLSLNPQIEQDLNRLWRLHEQMIENEEERALAWSLFSTSEFKPETFFEGPPGIWK